MVIASWNTVSGAPYIFYTQISYSPTCSFFCTQQVQSSHPNSTFHLSQERETHKFERPPKIMTFHFMIVI